MLANAQDPELQERAHTQIQGGNPGLYLAGVSEAEMQRTKYQGISAALGRSVVQFIFRILCELD